MINKSCGCGCMGKDAKDKKETGQTKAGQKESK